MSAAPDAGGSARFAIQAIVRPERHTLVLSGELDHASAEELQPLVVRICSEGARDLVLDITRLSFMDSTGLRAILSAQMVCRDHGVGFMLTPATGPVQRVFEVTGLTDVLPFAPFAG
jgi:anti-sigma B factor antagonist